ncbi:zinc-finger double domain-containing protein [Ditylenchus destructor]|nr:zinc-finger double domain-containing protein [Ditylenchus destructor]
MKSFAFSSGEIKAAIDEILQECDLLPARVDTIRQYLQQIIDNDSKFDPNDVIHSTVDTKYLHALIASFRDALVNNLCKRLNSVGIIEDRFEQGAEAAFDFDELCLTVNEHWGTQIDGISSRKSGNNSVKMERNTIHKCHFCSYSVDNKTSLKIHVRTHTGEKPYKCYECSSSFIQTSHLKMHMRSHTGEKPYKCSQCSYTCTRTSDLKTHMFTHTGEKPYKCNVCSYTTVTASDLNAHTRTHTGEKPYKCSQCSYASAFQCALKAHMRTHSNEKPFKCNVCSYASGDRKSIQCHMRTHTGEKPYKCMLCSHASTSSSALQTHMRSHQIKEK